MDALLTNTQFVNGAYPYWDFQIVGGIVPIISGSEEASQCAAVLAYTQFGLIPQLPSVGVNWTGMLTSVETLDSIDTQISTTINQAQVPYKQTYQLNGRQLVVNIVHQ